MLAFLCDFIGTFEPMAFRILLVEDEANIASAIKLNLELDNYHVTLVNNGKDAINEFKSARFDLIILDVMLPEVNGFDVCQVIRLENSEVPILFLTAKGTGEDKITGLKLGADDYLTKPFNLEELLLRISKLIKRSRKNEVDLNPLQSFKFGNNEVNFTTYEIIGNSKEKLTLNKREIQLLKLLIERKNQVVSREQILETVWGYDVYPSTRTIDNFIVAFRKYFEENPREPKYFHSIRGVGYKFTNSN